MPRVEPVRNVGAVLVLGWCVEQVDDLHAGGDAVQAASARIERLEGLREEIGR